MPEAYIQRIAELEKIAKELAVYALATDDEACEAYKQLSPETRVFLEENG